MALGLGGPAFRAERIDDRLADEATRLLTHPRADLLTWRERVALAGRARGLPATTIASRLGVRPHAVRSLLVNARRRLAGQGLRQQGQGRAHRAEGGWQPPAQPAQRKSDSEFNLAAIYW